MKTKSKIPRIIEICFDTFYLATVAILGVYFIVNAEKSSVYIWGVMALILVIGDAFHLIPRMLVALTSNTDRYKTGIALGKIVTSITMAIFYLLLWHAGLILFNVSSPIITAVIYVLVLLRILLTLSPKNKWFSDNPSIEWGLLRNIPFFIQGFIVFVFYLIHHSDPVKFIWLAILLSFIFYIPVVLWVHRNKKLAMLMLPKSLMYIWIVMYGLFF